MAELSEQRVIVTGANRGIGRCIAEQFALHGATVGLLGRREEAVCHAVEEIVKEHDPPGTLSPIVVDVTDPGAVQDTIGEWIDEHEGIHTLVNNAGINRDGLVMRMGEEDWESVLGTNLDGAFHCTKAVVRPMMRNRWGRVIMISSVVGLMGNPGQANYSASKSGMIGLSKSIARELGSRNITSNTVAPGFITTEMTEELPEERREDLLSSTPLERFGEPEDVAETVLFLASPRADFITGEVLRVDGGLAM